jgi:hypothetical protein
MTTKELSETLARLDEGRARAIAIHAENQRQAREELNKRFFARFGE